MKQKSLGFAALLFCIITILVVAFGLFGTGADTPEVKLPDSQGSGSGSPGSDQLGLGKYTSADITPETVQSVILTLKRADSYSRVVTVESFWNDGSSTTRLECHARDGDLLVVATGDGRTRHVLIKGERLYIWYDGSIKHFDGSATGDRPEVTDEYSRTLTYEELLSLDASQISDAGYENFAGEGCVFAEYTAGPLNYKTKVFVSISTGLLMGAERYDGETLIYRMSSDTPVVEPQEDRWFSPPS